MKKYKTIGLGLAALAAGMPSVAYANTTYVYAECRVGTCTLYYCTERSSETTLPDPMEPDLPDGPIKSVTFGSKVMSCSAFGSMPDVGY